MLLSTTTAKGGEKMKNLDIRKAIERNNIKYWQIADKLGITDGNFSRLLREKRIKCIRVGRRIFISKSL